MSNSCPSYTPPLVPAQDALAFSPVKSKYITVSLRGPSRALSGPLLLKDGHPLPHVPSLRYLGVQLDPALNFSSYWASIARGVRAAAGAFTRLCRGQWFLLRLLPLRQGLTRPGRGSGAGLGPVQRGLRLRIPARLLTTEWRRGSSWGGRCSPGLTSLLPGLGAGVRPAPALEGASPRAGLRAGPRHLPSGTGRHARAPATGTPSSSPRSRGPTSNASLAGTPFPSLPSPTPSPFLSLLLPLHFP